MDKHRITGAARQMGGRLKEVAGERQRGSRPPRRGRL